MHLRSAFLFTLVAVGVTGFAASPAYAVAPTLTVRPANQLVDIQVVTIRGAGFTPGSTLRVAECLASNVTLCDPFSEALPVGSRTPSPCVVRSRSPRTPPRSPTADRHRVYVRSPRSTSAT